MVKPWRGLSIYDQASLKYLLTPVLVDDKIDKGAQHLVNHHVLMVSNGSGL
jgi:hypothetical protein